MNLKLATLIAIAGNLIYLIGSQVMRFGDFQWNEKTGAATINIIYCALDTLSVGSLLLFLFVLYSKQK